MIGLAAVHVIARKLNNYFDPLIKSSDAIKMSI
jgi:hypothetical protein